MKRILILGFLAVIVLTACNGTTSEEAADGPGRDEVITIYKSPTWGCCAGWTLYLRGNGFTVKVEETENLTEIKSRYQVPTEVQSCHTAIVGGYVIEGHVPITEIERMLTERPDISGIGVAGMPPGSPGMDIAGFETDPYNVVSFDETGVIEVYAIYPK